jgi:prevent-host-death family protein
LRTAGDEAVDDGLHSVLYSSRMDPLTVTQAAALGVPALVRAAEAGDGVVVSRHGRPVAAVVSMERLGRVRALEDDLRDIALVLARAFGDNGERSGLDETLAAFGYDRAALQAELDADLAAGRE